MWKIYISAFYNITHCAHQYEVEMFLFPIEAVQK